MSFEKQKALIPILLVINDSLATWCLHRKQQEILADFTPTHIQVLTTTILYDLMYAVRLARDLHHANPEASMHKTLQITIFAAPVGFSQHVLVRLDRQQARCLRCALPVERYSLRYHSLVPLEGGLSLACCRRGLPSHRNTRHGSAPC